MSGWPTIRSTGGVRRTCAALMVSLLVGCGGPSATTAPAEAAAAGPSSSGGAEAWAEPTSLRALLSPIDVHQPPAQLAAIARFIRDWERDPYDEVAINDTGLSTPAAVLAWLSESPDVSVAICGFVGGIARDRGLEGSSPVTLGSMFGMAAYLIEHPGAEPTSAEVQVAGLESGLRWYEASLRRGQPRHPVVDEILARRDADGVRAWFDEQGIACGVDRAE